MDTKPDLTLREWAIIKDAVSDAIDGLDARASEDVDNADAINEQIDLLYGIGDKITHYLRGIN